MEITQSVIKEVKFNSKVMPDHVQSFEFLRKTPRLELAKVNTKSTITGGVSPVTQSDSIYIETLATLSVYVKPVKDGVVVKEANWIDQIQDVDFMYEIYSAWADYQASFYK